MFHVGKAARDLQPNFADRDLCLHREMAAGGDHQPAYRAAAGAGHSQATGGGGQKTRNIRL